jgi:hypothetical protein
MLTYIFLLCCLQFISVEAQNAFLGVKNTELRCLRKVTHSYNNTKKTEIE